jgi:hypothetical protein
MEVNNRFELLASLPVHEEPIETSFININSSEQQQQQQEDEHPTKNHWEIPEYVEKYIPCSSPLTTKVETSKPVQKERTSRHVKKVKPIVDIPKNEEQQDEDEIPVTVEAKPQPTTYSYYPPQPYKFKQTPSSEQNFIEIEKYLLFK